MLQKTVSGKIVLSIITIIGWFALIVQFYLQINSGIASKSELFIRFFSYFTILTNLLVTVCSTILVVKPNSSLGNFFKKQQTLTALTIYIVVVGIVYNVILRNIWDPQGIQKVVDELLHLIIPILFLMYWLIFVKKTELNYKNAFPWLIYPFTYAVFAFIRGLFSGFYPYPFINVAELGWIKVIQNTVILTLFFLGLSLMFIAVGKMMSKRRMVETF